MVSYDEMHKDGLAQLRSIVDSTNVTPSPGCSETDTSTANDGIIYSQTRPSDLKCKRTSIEGQFWNRACEDIQLKDKGSQYEDQNSSRQQGEQ